MAAVVRTGPKARLKWAWCAPSLPLDCGSSEAACGTQCQLEEDEDMMLSPVSGDNSGGPLAWSSQDVKGLGVGPI